MNTIRLEVVTPDGVVYSEEVDMVTLPAVDGQIGILPMHVPLMTQMVPGAMTVVTPENFGNTGLFTGGDLSAAVEAALAQIDQSYSDLDRDATCRYVHSGLQTLARDREHSMVHVREVVGLASLQCGHSFAL